MEIADAGIPPRRNRVKNQHCRPVPHGLHFFALAGAFPRIDDGAVSFVAPKNLNGLIVLVGRQ